MLAGSAWLRSLPHPKMSKAPGAIFALPKVKVKVKKIKGCFAPPFLRGKLKHRFYAIFDLVGSSLQNVIFFDTGQLAAQRFRITLLEMNLSDICSTSHQRITLTSPCNTAHVRQHGKFDYLKIKIAHTRCFQQCFSNFDFLDVGWLWADLAMKFDSQQNFLPRNAFRSIRH